MAVVFVSVEGVAVSIGRGLAVLADLLDPAEAVDFFTTATGLRLPEEFLTANPTLGNAVSAAASSAGTLDALADAVTEADGDAAVIAAGAELLIRITEVLGHVGDIGTELGSVPVPAGVSSTLLRAFGNEFASFIPRYAIVEFFRRRIPGLHPTLSFLGVVDDVLVRPGPSDDFDAHVRKELHPERARSVIGSPAAHFQTLVGWGAPGLVFEPGQPLFDRLDRTLKQLGFPMARVRDGTKLSLESQKLSVELNPSGTGLTARAGTSAPDGINRTGNLKPGVDVRLVSQGGIPFGTVFDVTPPAKLAVTPTGGGQFQASLLAEVRLSPTSGGPFRLIGVAGGTGIQTDAAVIGLGLDLDWDAGAGKAIGEFFATAGLEGAKIVLDLSAGDGFLSSLTGGRPLAGRVDIGARYGLSSGLSFTGGSLQVVIPMHTDLGGVRIDNLLLAFPFDTPGTGVPLTLATSLGATFGPFNFAISDVGIDTELGFPGGAGAIASFSARFKPPTGIGVSVDTGGVKGGGFLFLDAPAGRYGGALELSVFGVAVKAIGLIETKLPDGSSGFSFIIIISAEFIPIQLGFGFTLLGVGGIIGINRGLNDEGLGGALRDGSLDTILFPSDPVRDAPSIIQNLANIFPPARDHFVFGPTAKLGWGTPTLVHASLGIVLELPGPRLAILGVVRTSLPTEEFALVRLQLAIAGVLDFPGRRFSLDASLYDSYVGSFSAAGDMAFRLDFGGTPNFVLAIGGFNPSYKAPPGFPSLRRVSIDLGLNGNPSLTASGYLALTPNTAQIGAGLDLRASGAGIRLHGHLGFDAMFVFSPFSFDARIHAGMSVRFHGVGFGIHLNGRLSGPSPWHLDGEVCVSVLWWDACLGVDVTFGERRRAELPPIDPWLGLVPFDPQRPVLGLQTAIQDARNWKGTVTAGATPVVALAERPTGVASPVDPVGAATLRQKVVPLNQKITKFGEFSPVGHDTFKVTTVLIGGAEQNNVVPEQDDFVPAHFKQMSSSERLSAKPYDKMDAGFTVDAHLATVGTLGEKEIVYETQLLDGNRERVGPQPLYPLTRRHLLGMLGRSAAALGGSRRAGLSRYFNPLVKVALRPERFVVADSCTFAPNLSIVPSAGATQMAAALAVEAHVGANPADQGRFAVVPSYELF